MVYDPMGSDVERARRGEIRQSHLARLAIICVLIPKLVNPSTPILRLCDGLKVASRAAAQRAGFYTASKRVVSKTEKRRSAFFGNFLRHIRPPGLARFGYKFLFCENFTSRRVLTERRERVSDSVLISTVLKMKMTTQVTSESAVFDRSEIDETAPSRRTLTRLDLAEAVQSRVPVSRRQGIRLVQMVIDEIVDTLASGEGVKLSGFGTFQIRSKAERLGRNPKNGEPARIASRKVVVFRASRLLKAGIADPKSDN